MDVYKNTLGGNRNTYTGLEQWVGHVIKQRLVLLFAHKSTKIDESKQTLFVSNAT